MLNSAQTVAFKLVFCTANQIAPFNVDVFISIVPTLFVKEPNRVHQFVYDGSNLNATRVQGKRLSAASSTYE
jgi:hypothetical protein